MRYKALKFFKAIQSFRVFPGNDVVNIYAKAFNHEKISKDELACLLAGLQAPEGICVCQDRHNSLIVFDTTKNDPFELINFYSKFRSLNHLGGTIKDYCNGNYARR